MASFKELLHLSFKSEDTEEWLDVHFNRPIGLVFALLWKRLHVHPNTITILSIVLGIGAAYNFYFTDVSHNLWGVLLLVLANLCDSTDGQLARLTNQRSFVGRVLDGFSGDVWFFCIYAALCLRLQNQFIPFTDSKWGLYIWLLAFVGGILCHSPQSSLSDYYRQIHLFFLKGKEGSELDNYQQQRALYESLPKTAWLQRAFYFNYANYCKSQERRTPCFQQFFMAFMASPSAAIREEFLEGSRPLMKYTNILTFNTRAIGLYATTLLGCPWLFFVFDVTVFEALYIYMHHRHECLSSGMLMQINRSIN